MTQLNKKQSNSLKDYILHLDHWIPKSILDETLKELSDEKNWKEHTYFNQSTFKDVVVNKDKEPYVCYGDNLTHLKSLKHLIWTALDKYIRIDKISGASHSNWNGFSQIRFNKYNKNQIMSKHTDHILSLFTGERRGIPVLSIVCLLNDDYGGGEFIMFDDYEIKFKAGDMIIFPSVFLYPHLVKPVTKGNRYSFVSWCY
tara:strand:+ start:2109 stop:2708 length:600 start_codon:yes stop_codon:yes gene_type:complete